jgi:hypothetical protein
MFKIQDGKLVWGDCEYDLPEEFKNIKHTKIFGTATAGLTRKIGILISQNGVSGSVACSHKETVSGHLIEGIKNGEKVFLREQLDVENPDRTFWLISSNEILNQLNWINIEFNNKTLRLCPFTKHYKVINA